MTHPDPYPEGWFRIVDSDEVPTGAVVIRTAFGRELVIFRSQAGRIAVTDPHCPHLGAHLGHGGRVEGDSLRCPFHGFRWGTDGACRSTGYPCAPRVPYRLGTWPCRERYGSIYIFFSKDRHPPDWELPDIDEQAWTTPQRTVLRFRGHVQDAVENLVDFEHFRQVHGFSQVRGKHVEFGDRTLRAECEFARSNPLLPGSKVRIRLTARIYGLGLSVSDIELPAFGIRYRLFTNPTPVNEHEFDLALALSCPLVPDAIAQSHTLPRPVRSSLLWRIPNYALVWIAKWHTARDAENDRPIWAHKTHLDRPGLVRGDGPIGQFRRYVRRQQGSGFVDRSDAARAGWKGA
jgi:phenylpropionate dioxygenase-like ring-hydroxylating dioxygenase large terminal subunit